MAILAGKEVLCLISEDAEVLLVMRPAPIWSCSASTRTSLEASKPDGNVTEGSLLSHTTLKINPMCLQHDLAEKENSNGYDPNSAQSIDKV